MHSRDSSVVDQRESKKEYQEEEEEEEDDESRADYEEEEPQGDTRPPLMAPSTLASWGDEECPELDLRPPALVPEYDMDWTHEADQRGPLCAPRKKLARVEVTTRVYVGNLAWNVEWQDLKTL